MKISLNWLRDYVDVKESPSEVGRSLTMHSAEVEEVKSQAELLDKVVVGKIKKIKKHPNADKLKLVDTVIGQRVVQIVCGGTNLKEGLWVAVAQPGAKVRWHGGEELIVLEKTKIRGELSEGMICLDSEIGLGSTKGTEVMELNSYSNLKPGLPLAELLGLDDVILDIDNKSLTHRSDLFSHIGLAREYAAIKNRKLRLPARSCLKAKHHCKLKVRVEATELCRRYMAIVLDKIEVKPSPQWMQKRLLAVGMRPLNNLVDITNYVMLEFGQPLHIFDYHKLFKQTILVRKARKDEVIKTLDNKNRKLNGNMLVIADQQKAIAIAGVMGGANSEIDMKTKTIVLESANFEKFNIRKTTQRLDLHTEASLRFEKGLGLDLCEQAFQRAVDLLIKYANAQVSSKLYDYCGSKLKPKIVQLDLDYLKQYTGIEIPSARALNILSSLELKTKLKKKKLLEVQIPLFRTDLHIAEDLIEEITRIFGYDQIIPRPLFGKLEPVLSQPHLVIGDKLRHLLVGWGFTEVMNYSFYGSQDIKKAQLQQQNHIELANPLSDDLRYLRLSLLPGLLRNIEYNLHHNFKDLSLFEIGHLYFLPKKEIPVIGVVITGDALDIFFKAKGVLEGLTKELNIEYKLKRLSSGNEKDLYVNIFQSSLYTRVYCQGQDIGNLNLISQKLLDNYGIDQQVAYLSLCLEGLAKYANTEITYKPLYKFPPVTIDLSIVISQQYSWQQIKEEILSSSDLIKDIQLFDLYQGKNIGKDKKSFAMHLMFQSEKRTLEMKEITEIRERIVQNLNQKFKAEIRK